VFVSYVYYFQVEDFRILSLIRKIRVLQRRKLRELLGLVQRLLDRLRCVISSTSKVKCNELDTIILSDFLPRKK